MRVLLITGKGGVGKTTTAAATALACARRGARTLVMSTDPAHSLADAFDRPLGPDPVEIEAGLWGQQLDAQTRLETAWGDLRSFLSKLLDWAGAAAIEAEELSVIPGLDEIFALTDLKAAADSGQWDVIVVDCAPTAETLRLLALPEVLSWWMDRFFPIARRLLRAVGPMVGAVTGVPIADERVLDAVQRFYDRLSGLRELLADPDVTSARLVVVPERVVIAEARRLATYLSLFGYRVDAVVANRLLPADLDAAFFERWKKVQAEHLDTIRSGFDPLPVLEGPLFDDELVGPERLGRFAEALYGTDDPARRMHHGTVLSVERRDGDWVLRLPLPFAEKDGLRLSRKGSELLVRVGTHRRAILLPDSLQQRSIVDAALREGTLEVTFRAH